MTGPWTTSRASSLAPPASSSSTAQWTDAALGQTFENPKSREPCATWRRPRRHAEDHDRPSRPLPQAFDDGPLAAERRRKRGLDHLAYRRLSSSRPKTRPARSLDNGKPYRIGPLFRDVQLRAALFPTCPLGDEYRGNSINHLVPYIPGLTSTPTRTARASLASSGNHPVELPSRCYARVEASGPAALTTQPNTL